MKGVIRHMLGWLDYRIESVRYTPAQLLDPAALRTLELDDVICRHMHDHAGAFTFLQVGAYDGVSTDPLRKYIVRHGWRGVMIEPQPGPASQLRELYPPESGVTIVEAAVDFERGTRTLYVVDSAELPKWVGGMASFDPAHIARHEYLVPGIAKLVRQIEVPAVTFDDALDQLGSSQLSLLQIDAEGSDGYLLSLFPFRRIRPSIVHWEIKNMDRESQESAIALLRGHGYRIARSGTEDMLAVLDLVT